MPKIVKVGTSTRAREGWAKRSNRSGRTRARKVHYIDCVDLRGIGIVLIGTSYLKPDAVGQRNCNFAGD